MNNFFKKKQNSKKKKKWKEKDRDEQSNTFSIRETAFHQFSFFLLTNSTFYSEADYVRRKARDERRIAVNPLHLNHRFLFTFFFWNFAASDCGGGHQEANTERVVSSQVFARQRPSVCLCKKNLHQKNDKPPKQTLFTTLWRMPTFLATALRVPTDKTAPFSLLPRPARRLYWRIRYSLKKKRKKLNCGFFSSLMETKMDVMMFVEHLM